jgi:DNA-binding transcriptional LysR family regulator
MGVVDLSQLRYFNAVAQHGSFSAAAKALGISQPGLTKAVRRLETSLECNLFDRLPRGVALTRQGLALLRHANQLNVQLHDAREEVRALGRGVIGQLRIGAGPSWITRGLPGIIARMTAEYPRLSFQVVGGFNSSLMESLRSGDLDLVLSALPEYSPPGLQAVPLTRDTMSVVARRDHPLCQRRRMSPSSTLAFPWVLPGRHVLSRLRLEALFRVAGLNPPAATIEADSMSFIAGVLRDSDMLSFATSQIIRSEMDGIAPLMVPGLSTTRSAGILFRSSAGVMPATRAMIAALERFAREIGDN